MVASQPIIFYFLNRKVQSWASPPELKKVCTLHSVFFHKMTIHYLVLSRDDLPLVVRSPGKKPLIESPLRLKGSELLVGASGSKKGKKEIN